MNVNKNGMRRRYDGDGLATHPREEVFGADRRKHRRKNGDS